MTPDQWQQVKEIFSRASELEEPARARYLEEACGGGADLRAEVESLLAVHRRSEAIVDRFAADYLPAGVLDTHPDRWLGRRMGAYEIVALLGRGGMGEVYQARRADAHYEKQVAIKVVRGGYNTEYVLQRFKAERQILASLDHPNIARLVDGAATEEGVPYLVMELVDGEPIDTYCEKHRLPIAERLRLFREVCAAVSYAHRHLVVHRDLKPRNILVTAGGTIKLLDFGIAKLLQGPGDSPAEATRTAMAALTPAFSSPEQILGLPITTASDVYSLGVVLFHLLTGRSPYRGTLASTQDAIREVCESDPERPSALAATARDLDDITLMALRKEPDRRYASVEQLSDDVQRYLTGQPVAAHGGRALYRAGKFARRHKVEIAAAFIVALALIGGVIAATHQAHIAQREKLRAERDFARTRQLANSLIFELHDSIQDLPGATSARKLLVERALQYLDSLAQESASDESLQRDLAAAYQRVGDVQGNPFAANLGDTAGALRSYQAALKLREAVFAAHRDSAVDGVALAQALRLHADALSMSGSVQAAGVEARRAVDTAEPIVRAHPADKDALEELCLGYADLGGILGSNLNSANLNDQTAALKAHENQLDAARRLVVLDPKNRRYRSHELVAEFTLGDQLLLAGQIHEASAHYRRGMDLLDAASNEAMGRADLQRLHGGYNRMGFVLLWNHEPLGGLAYQRKALELASKLSVEDPNDAYARLSLASDYANVADASSQIGDFDEARADVLKSKALMGALVQGDPSNSEYRVTSGLSMYLAGEVARRAGDRAGALKEFRAAFAIFDKTRAEDPNNVDARLDAASALVKVADMQMENGEDEAASAQYRESLAKAGADTPAERSEEARYAIAGAQAGLGAIESRRGHRAAACDWFTRGSQTWDTIREPGSTSPNGFYTTAGEVLRRERAHCEPAATRDSARSGADLPLQPGARAEPVALDGGK